MTAKIGFWDVLSGEKFLVAEDEPLDAFFDPNSTGKVEISGPAGVRRARALDAKTLHDRLRAPRSVAGYWHVYDSRTKNFRPVEAYTPLAKMSRWGKGPG